MLSKFLSRKLLSFSPLSRIISTNGAFFRHRITDNLVAEPLKKAKPASFTFNNLPCAAYEGEMISSALIANGINIFGRHPKDNSPQSLYCANGQCSACTVLVNGAAVKSCITPLQHEMVIESGTSHLNVHQTHLEEIMKAQPANFVPKSFDVLIIGAGPAGMNAALEISKYNDKLSVLLIDDKDRVGGKLVLQTHKFFGSVSDTRAGTRGQDIAHEMYDEIKQFPNIKIRLESTAVGVFNDKLIGIYHQDNKQYQLYDCKALLVATGAREKMIVFPGNTLPGVYGAGAFQTLVNRDWIRLAKRIIIVGGGNVGLITAYHAIQAGIEVVCLIEALDEIGGYKVHADKIKRLGVPILTRHTIVKAEGNDHVESATICQIDNNFQPIQNTEKTFAVDCVLVAVGLDKVDEFATKAKQYQIPVYTAGDSQEIAEASSAMVSGRIAGLEILKQFPNPSLYQSSSLQKNIDELTEKVKVLRMHPGKTLPSSESGYGPNMIRPVLHCHQEIPCNACSVVCAYDLLKMKDISSVPYYETKHEKSCRKCLKCVAICPGLAITVVDGRDYPKNPFVTFPFEINNGIELEVGDEIQVMDEKSNVIGSFPIEEIEHNDEYNTIMVTVQLPVEHAFDAASIWRKPISEESTSSKSSNKSKDEDEYICRCERVSVKDILKAIEDDPSICDINQIKSVTRQGMGSCGGKTCNTLIHNLLKKKQTSKNIPIIPSTNRPLFIEVPLQEFAKIPTPPQKDGHMHSLVDSQQYSDNVKQLHPPKGYKYDVIIMGAGSLGVNIARSLPSSLKTLVVDQYASVGQGDNKKAIGGVRMTFGQSSKIRLMGKSLEIFRNWKRDKGDDLEYCEDGYFFPVYTENDEKNLKNLLTVQHKYGLDINWVDSEEIQKLLPGINPENLRGGTHSPHDGQLSPLKAMSAFYKDSRLNGSHYKFNQKIVGFITSPTNSSVLHGIQTISADKPDERNFYYAPLIINTLGASTNKILSALNINLPIFPDSHEAGITEPVAPVFKGMIVDIRAFPGSKNCYFYQNYHGQFVFCVTPDPAIEGFNTEETSVFLPLVSKRLIHLFPSIGSVLVRRVWRGLYANTSDGNPFVSFDPQISGLFHCCGMGGHGFMLGPGMGELVSRVVTQKDTDLDREMMKDWQVNRKMKGDEMLR